MKKLIFVCGPNGIGKTTISKEILKQLPRSAYVDTDPLRFMNPFTLNDETIPTIAKNISDLIANYLNCPAVETVILSYGLHGRRKEVLNMAMSNLREFKYSFFPFLLICSEEENVRRMKADQRSAPRIKRALDRSRKAYGDTPYPQFNVTELSPGESARRIIRAVGLKMTLEEQEC